MKAKVFMVATTVALLLFSFGYFAVKGNFFFKDILGSFMGFSFGSYFETPEIHWKDLEAFDYITGEASSYLKGFHDKPVKVPGFMVPLEDHKRSVTEFLLVPTPQACIHVPPPPPNQMILVKTQQGFSTPVAMGPIWVYGTFRLQGVRHQYGESSFSLEVFRVEPYQ
jgi:uncharacterized protein